MSNAIPVKNFHKQIKLYSIELDSEAEVKGDVGKAIRKFLVEKGVTNANFHLAKQNGYLLLAVALSDDQTDWTQITGFGGVLTGDGIPDFTQLSDLDIT